MILVPNLITKRTMLTQNNIIKSIISKSNIITSIVTSIDSIYRTFIFLYKKFSNYEFKYYDHPKMKLN